MLALLLQLAVATPTDAELHVMLSPRHDPGCPGDPTATPGLARLADQETMPPWVGIRAVACVARQADVDPVALEHADRWVADAARPGLALVVLAEVQTLSEPVQQRVFATARSTALRDARYARWVTVPDSSSSTP